ncbi:MAG TPA: proton-conducting transporter membrane subunit [Verrucomicrobiae bacterium]|nr:proton-conducting transporter membrane subunit [Verrucomicrobiae bacterium]
MSAIGAWMGAFFILCSAGIVLALLIPDRRNPRWLAWIGGLASLVLLGASGQTLFGGNPWSITLWTVADLGTLTINMDRLSALFAFITGLVFLPVSVFAATNLPRYGGRYSLKVFSVMYLALLASIVLVLIASDVLLFLLAWEAMSILCYLLVNYEHEESDHTRAGYLMLAVSEAGALAAVVAFLILGVSAGSLAFPTLKSSAVGLGAGARWTVFLLSFFGFGVKAGLVPVNFWLPRAYTAAPSAFVPILAGATLNLGFYGIVRINTDLLPMSMVGPGVVVMIVGTLSALLGILYATTNNDLKTMLAHSSIENAGIIAVGLGAGMIFMAYGLVVPAGIAFVAALYHLTNHSLYKALLFLGAGTVEQRVGLRDLDRLGGLIRRMPWTALAFLAGALSISALPPFNGFVSEWLTLQTMLRSAVLSSTGVKVVFALCGAGLALTAALAVTCFVKAFAMGFLGMPRSDSAEKVVESRRSALASMGLLAGLCLALGVLPTYVIPVLSEALTPLTGSNTADALVPPFFSHSPEHERLPGAFAAEFHDLGAQVGQSVMPGRGLVVLHRGGKENPVVFAMSTSYTLIVLAGLLGLSWVVARFVLTRQRSVVRRTCWDGGVRRLLPEMTYTATGFSNPVRVIFDAVFRPATTEDTPQTVAQHFRTAIHREREEVYIIDRLIGRPGKGMALKIAGVLATLHRGRINVYIAYALLSLLLVLLLSLL